MYRYHKLLCSTLAILMAHVICRAEVELLPPSIYGVLEAGRISSGWVAGVKSEKQWDQRAGAGFIQTGNFNDSWSMTIGMGGVRFSTFPLNIGSPDQMVPYNAFYTSHAKFDWKRNDEPGALKFDVGMFPVKYNKDAVNLGEYFFRSTAYPTTIVTGGYTNIGNTAGVVQGVQASQTLAGFNYNAFITYAQLYPMGDVTLAGLASYNFFDIAEIGFGISLDRILPIRPSQTTPSGANQAGNGVVNRSYLNTHPQTGLPLTGTITDPVSGIDSTFLLNRGYEIASNHKDVIYSVVDPLAAETDWVKLSDAEAKAANASFDADPTDPTAAYRANYMPLDTSYFSFQAVRIMGRLNLDFKPLFGGLEDVMSSRDMTLYSEVILLGVKDYPLLYESKKERTAVMLGLHLPTFNLFDVFAIEGEYWPSTFSNDVEAPYWSGFPIPYNTSEGAEYTQAEIESRGDLWKRDDWKWSLLAEKSFSKHITFSLQAASDHLRALYFRTLSPEEGTTLRHWKEYYIFSKLTMHI